MGGSSDAAATAQRGGGGMAFGGLHWCQQLHRTGTVWHQHCQRHCQQELTFRPMRQVSSLDSQSWWGLQLQQAGYFINANHSRLRPRTAADMPCFAVTWCEGCQSRKELR